MAAIDKIKAHFDRNRQSNDQRSRMGSCDSRDAGFHFGAQGDLQRNRRKRHPYAARANSDRQSEGRNGDSLFSKADEPFMLNRADPKVLFRVAGQILGNDAPEARELGNS
jgi:hypothetical protein